MTSWHSYPKVWNFGHAAVNEILNDEVLVEEKIDGSQFSFGVFDGQLRFKSKGKDMTDAPEKMFKDAIAQVIERKDLLVDGWTYRAEYLQKPKHNILAYSRIPKGNLIIFDINTGEERYLPYVDKSRVANNTGFECVPLLHHGKVTLETFKELLERDSVLGGQKIEGVVVKNYSKFGPDKKALMAKHVSERFKEKHKNEWKQMNPQSGDILLSLAEKYRSQVRWEKAVQHFRDDGKLLNAPQDIGPLICEIKQDALVECKAEIMEDLFKWAWPQIERKLSNGFPEWYKDQLLKKQFEDSKCA